MNKRIWLIFAMLIIGMAVFACQGEEAAPTELSAVEQSATPSATPSITATPSPTIDATQGFYQTLTARPTRTKVNTYTPKPLMPTKTATIDDCCIRPTTPTFTPYPTLDPAKNITATPALANICVPLSSEEAPIPEFLTDRWDEGRFTEEETILEYFNLYGGETFEELLAIEKVGGDYSYVQAIQDFTNDGQPEYAIEVGYLYIIGCVDGTYQVLLKDYDPLYSGYSAEIKIIEDGNRNGVPELIILDRTWESASTQYRVVEWINGQFVDVLDPDLHSLIWPNAQIYITVRGDVYFEDIDSDYIKELVVEFGDGWGFLLSDNFPWRHQTKYYKWDGRFYLYLKTDYSEPEYRYQAVQDGDRFTSRGEYDLALESYQDVIFNIELDGMTRERSLFWHHNGWDINHPDYPELDPNEYHYLASYSRFRIMLLYVLQGWMQDAEVVYDTLLEMYPEGEAGHEFALAAELFWEEYQQSNDIAVSCDQVIALAKTFDESIFDYFGKFSIEFDKYYYPEDFCPFGTAPEEGE